MKAMILAAGLGTRLRPWTLEHPKALVPVNGVPMLQHVINRLKSQGFDRLVINVHHFAEQIVDFIGENDFGVEVNISDETGKLLDTGGGIVHARQWLESDGEPFIVHNVDILSDAPLAELWNRQKSSVNTDATLLVSRRDSSRRLLFDGSMNLRAWHNQKDDAWKLKDASEVDRSWKDYAFSGIYAMSVGALQKMARMGERFPVMDYFLSPESEVEGMAVESLNLIDIGKPETLARASDFIDKIS